MILRPFILALTFVGAIAAASAAQQDVVSKLDPRADDWPAEALARTAGDQLGAMLSSMLTALGRGEDDGLPEFVKDARASRLVAEIAPALAGRRLATVAVPAAEGPTVAADVALREWATVIGTGVGTRVKVKLLSAELRGAAPGGAELDGAELGRSEFRAKARIEALGGGDGAWVQQIATWQLRWDVSSAGELTLREIFVLGGEQSTSAALWFHDVTKAVLPRSLRERPDLRLGGESWPDRIDHVGESTRMGHQGLAVGDVNGDGREDFYVAMCGGLPNLLLQSRADGTFDSVAEASNVAFLDETKGVLLLDMDGDGDDDLLAAIGPFVLLGWNDGRGVFDKFTQLRAPTDGAFYHLAAADFDGDGDLDVYGCRYVEEAYATSVPMPFHDANNGPANVLFRNDGLVGEAWQFTNVTVEVGLDVNNRRFSTAAAWADIDGDGDLDLYVSNDFGRNCLYRNDGGRFVEVAAAAGVEDQAAGMGVAFADVDEDGDQDLYVTNMFSSAGHRIAFQERFQKKLDATQRDAIRDLARGNSLFLNRGDGTFERSANASIRMGRWGWGARFCDLDGDGREDIVAPNGFLTGQVPDDC